MYSRGRPVSSSVPGITQSRINLRGCRWPEACAGETILYVCERVRHAMSSAGIGNGGDWWDHVRRSTGSGKSD